MTHALYNEIDPFAVAWLRALVDAGHIAPGRVDERSIAELQPADLAAAQVHFFAGIGGWSHALRLAGWPDDAPVWTGSCPCQPFSVAGKRRGTADERHLWPEWFRLIRECRPPVVLGEQVASPDGLAWFDAVSADLEGAGYAVGAADLSAAGVGAPHIRQRLYFVAVADGERREGLRVHLRERQPRAAVLEAAGRGEAGELADGSGTGRGRTRSAGVADGGAAAEPGRRGGAGELGDTGGTGAERDTGASPGAEAASEGRGFDDRTVGDAPVPPGATRGFWHPADWIPCRDGKARPVKPGSFPLAARLPGDVGLLRGSGNSVVPQVAAEFIAAVMDIL